MQRVPDASAGGTVSAGSTVSAARFGDNGLGRRRGLNWEDGFGRGRSIGRRHGVVVVTCRARWPGTEVGPRRDRGGDLGRPGPGEAAELALGQAEKIGQAQAERAGRGGEHLGRGLLAAALDLGEVRHRDPGGLGHILERAFLGETLAAQDIADDVPPQRLPDRRRPARPRPGRRGRRGGRARRSLRGGPVRAAGRHRRNRRRNGAQWDDAGLVRRVAAHLSRVGASCSAGRRQRSALGELRVPPQLLLKPGDLAVKESGFPVPCLRHRAHTGITHVAAVREGEAGGGRRARSSAPSCRDQFANSEGKQ